MHTWDIVSDWVINDNVIPTYVMIQEKQHEERKSACNDDDGDDKYCNKIEEGV